MRERINKRAIIYGVVSYPVFYLVLLILSNTILPSEEGELQKWMAALVSIIGWFIYLVPGYVAGRISHIRGIPHGFIVGIIVGVISATLFWLILGERWYGESLALNTFYYISFIVFMASIGGGLGQLHSKYSFKA
ncbi:MAG: hypothetical protein ABW127_19535 [Candidatus Thiodiazotropha endolucinida]